MLPGLNFYLRLGLLGPGVLDGLDQDLGDNLYISLHTSLQTSMRLLSVCFQTDMQAGAE